MKFTRAQLLQQLTPVLGARRFIIAYSGGLDSLVLLSAMAELRDQLQGAQLIALHIHHGINSAADDWAEHCARICQHLTVPLHVRRINADSGSENALREARYRAFQAYLQAGDILLLAHHADDQTETVLLRLLRGSGAKGGAGMSSFRELGKSGLYRPLLVFSRRQLEVYATERHLQWIEDDSNRDTQYDRNYLRHRVMPLLAARWPGCRNTINRHARLDAELQQSIDFFLSRELEQIGQEQNRLPIERLRRYPQAVQRNLIRCWLASLGLPIPNYRQLNQVLDEVVAAREDAQPLATWPGAWVRRYQQYLYAGYPLPPQDPGLEYTWHTEQPLSMPVFGTLTLQPAAADSEDALSIMPQALLTVRFRQGGERCRPAGRTGSHPLKKLLQEHAVPPWLRDRIPLLYQEEQLIAVADLWVCERFAAEPGESAFKVIFQPQ